IRTTRPSKPSSRSASAALAPASAAPTITCVVSGMCGPSGECQELLTCTWIVAHETMERRGDRAGSRLDRAAERHAGVLGLEHHAHALRRELALEPVGDLRGQPLLHLEAAGEVVDHPRELREAHDPVARDVGHVRYPDEREQVVLAERVERDV